MPRAKPKSTTQPHSPPANGPTAEVLNLAEAAAYLRLPEAEVMRLVRTQGLPGRSAGPEWRFLKAAIQEWLGKPAPHYSKEAQLAAAGTFSDDPDLPVIVEDIYRKRGRPITEDGSYDPFHGLDREGHGK